MKLELTERELDVIEAVLLELKRMPYEKVNTFLGTETINDMYRIHSKLFYRDWCYRNNKKYEDMTEDDFERAYRDIYDC